MSLLQNSNAISAGGGYTVDNSLRFRSSASAYLSRTPASSGTRTTWTWSGWVKRGALGASHAIISCGAYSANLFQVFFDDSTNTLRIQNFPNSTTPDVNIHTSQVFRDPSAWYHIVVVMDTTQATSSNRVKMYVNGSQVTAFSTATYPAQNATPNWNTGSLQHNIGARDASTLLYDGYLAETYFIDGSAKTPSDFGETDTTTGVWKPKAYTGTYGTNGFYLKFSDIATTSGSNAGLGKDFANTNYWTTNNISVTSGTTYDAMIDSPTNTSATVANYAVINPLDVTTATISNANLTMTSTSAAHRAIRASIGISSGKWYWEQVFTGASQNGVCGVGTNTASLATYVGGDANSWGYYSANGLKYNNGSGTSYGATYAANDIIGIAFDADAGTLVFYKNNVSQGTAYTLTTGVTYYPMLSQYNSDIWNINFGQRPFSYTPPTGYVRLNTYNLPTPTVLKGNTVMDATTYTGDGTNKSITNAGSFKPDLVWVKSRSNAEWNILFDSVRGTGKSIYSNDTSAEVTNAGNGYVSAFNTNGYSVTAGGTSIANVNANTYTYVAWQWQAGQGTTSSNTSGSITSTVSVNTTAGFSIVTYTGNGGAATVGHGLGVAPKMIIIKSRSNATDWIVYHVSLGNTNMIKLNLTSAVFTGTNYWSSTTPTSSVFSVNGTADVEVNGNGRTFVAYAFAEIAGFSKFGSYTGNGSADGPFVFTNLKPRFVMIKRTDTTSNWTILDTAREGYNVDNDPLYPNLANAEGTTDLADILSNGFKLRSTDASVNANTGTYIYACFASNPFRNSLAV